MISDTKKLWEEYLDLTPAEIDLYCNIRWEEDLTPNTVIEQIESGNIARMIDLVTVTRDDFINNGNMIGTWWSAMEEIADCMMDGSICEPKNMWMIFKSEFINLFPLHSLDNSTKLLVNDENHIWVIYDDHFESITYIKYGKKWNFHDLTFDEYEESGNVDYCMYIECVCDLMQYADKEKLDNFLYLHGYTNKYGYLWSRTDHKLLKSQEWHLPF